MADSDTNGDLGAATRAADRRLKAAHRDEWNQYKQEEAKERGLDWSPRLTGEQKAEADLAKLIEQYPHLAEKIKADGISAVI